jgi:hypothetical protein
MVAATRTRTLLLLSAVVTASMLLVQLAMVNVMTAVYAGGGGDIVDAAYAVSVSAEQQQLPKKRVRVYEPIEMQAPDPLPVVIMHGMGDAAGNKGMMRIRDVRRSLLLFFWCSLSWQKT